MEQQYNMKSPAVKRLMREAKELCEPTDEYYAQPVEENLFEWHFTVRGPTETDFEGGVYHGRIVLPPEYPMKPPSIILLTPNGRFEVNKKICLSISGHHPESWQPSWSIRTALLAIIGFMPTQGLGAIGSLDYTTEERKTLAKKSHGWSCSVCGPIQSLISEQSNASPRKVNEEAKSLALQISFKGENDQSTGSGVKLPEIEEAEINPVNESNASGTTSSTGSPNESNTGAAGNDRMAQVSTSASASATTVASSPSSSSRFLGSTGSGLSYLAMFLVAAIAALVFRRLFIL